MKEIDVAIGKYDSVWPKVLYDGENLLPPPSRIMASCAINHALTKNGAFNSTKEIESLISQGWNISINEDEDFIVLNKDKYRLIINIRTFDDTSESLTMVLVEK